MGIRKPFGAAAIAASLTLLLFNLARAQEPTVDAAPEPPQPIAPANPSAQPAEPATAQAVPMEAPIEEPAASFIDEPSVDVHGFGSWAFGATSKSNSYLSGSPDGEYRTADFALNVHARVNEHLSVVAQAAWHSSASGLRLNLDYAFGEWTFDEHFRLRAGLVKQPFGISTEVFAVGTLRPFMALPQAVYGPVGLVGTNYQGVGITGSFFPAAGWRLGYDLYGGGMTLEEFPGPEEFLHGDEVSPNKIFEESTRHLIGGRFVVETPVTGLSFGVSGYGGREITSNNRYVFGAHVEYAGEVLLVRAEYAHETVIHDLIVDGAYLEAAVRVTEHWQIAAQAGWLTSRLPGVDTSFARSFLDHKELAGGLNYWFSPEFVIKAGYHFVKGNRFAAPFDETRYAPLVEQGKLRTTTHLLSVAAQFNF